MVRRAGGFHCAHASRLVPRLWVMRAVPDFDKGTVPRLGSPKRAHFLRSDSGNQEADCPHVRFSPCVQATPNGSLNGDGTAYQATVMDGEYYFEEGVDGDEALQVRGAPRHCHPRPFVVQTNFLLSLGRVSFRAPMGCCVVAVGAGLIRMRRVLLFWRPPRCES